MRESAKAATCDFGIAERVWQDTDQQFTIGIMPGCKPFVGGITHPSDFIAGKWHGCCQRKAVQQSVPLRLTHPLVQKLLQLSRWYVGRGIS